MFGELTLPSNKLQSKNRHKKALVGYMVVNQLWKRLWNTPPAALSLYRQFEEGVEGCFIAGRSLVVGPTPTSLWFIFSSPSLTGPRGREGRGDRGGTGPCLRKKAPDDNVGGGKKKKMRTARNVRIKENPNCSPAYLLPKNGRRGDTTI